MAKKSPFVLVNYDKRYSDKGLYKFAKSKKRLQMKESPLSKDILTRVENEEKIKLTPRVYEVKDLFKKYGNTAIEYDKSIFIDSDMPRSMKELAIYHELKEIAGKEKGMTPEDAHLNARRGEIQYAKDMGLYLDENPYEYSLIKYKGQLWLPKLHLKRNLPQPKFKKNLPTKNAVDENTAYIEILDDTYNLKNVVALKEYKNLGSKTKLKTSLSKLGPKVRLGTSLSKLEKIGRGNATTYGEILLATERLGDSKRKRLPAKAWDIFKLPKKTVLDLPKWKDGK